MAQTQNTGITVQQPGFLSGLWGSLRGAQAVQIGSARNVGDQPAGGGYVPQTQGGNNDGSQVFEALDPTTADKLQKSGYISDKAYSVVVARGGFSLNEISDLAKAGDILETAWPALVGRGIPFPTIVGGIATIYRKQWSNPTTTAITAASTAAVTVINAYDQVASFTIKLAKNRRLVQVGNGEMYCKPGNSWTSNLTSIRLIAKITSDSDSTVASSDSRTFTVTVYTLTTGNGAAVASISAGTYEGLLTLASFPDGKVDVNV